MDKQEKKIISIAVFLGILMGLVDNIFDYLIFYRGMTWWDLFVLKVPPHEIYMRSLIFVFFTIFGFICIRYIRQIKQAEGRYQRLFNNVNDMIFVRPLYDINHQEKYSDVNSLACKKLGYTREELLQLTINDLIEPNKWAQLLPLMQRLEKEKDIIYEIDLLTKEGSKLPVEISSHLHEDRGGVTIYCTARDLSLRIQSEEEKKRLTSFPELHPSPVLEVNESGTITYTNLASKEVLKKLGLQNLAAFLPPDLNEIIENAKVVGINQFYREVLIGGAVFADYIYFVPRYNVTRIHPIDITTQRRAEEALRESELQLRLLTSQLLNVQETERKRIAEELHDELGQALLFVKLQLGAIHAKLPKNKPQLINESAELLNYLDHLVENIRKLLLGLNLSIVEEVGLSSAMSHLLDELGRHYKLEECRLDFEDDIDNVLNREAKLHTYRIFQEVITNACKHAQATKITGVVRLQHSQILFAIQDNGQGFDRGSVAGRGVGLATIEERLRMLGGHLEISSPEGGGTRVLFTVPMAQCALGQTSPNKSLAETIRSNSEKH